MAYPEGNYANVLRAQRARGEAVAPPIAPVAQDAAARAAAVRALKEEEAAAAASAPVSQAPVQSTVPGAEQSYSDRFLAEQRLPAVDDRYAGVRAQIMSEALREVMSPQEPVPKTNFSQFYTPEFVQERVNQLRGDQTFGGLLAMSGDKALAPFGRDLMRQSDPTQFMQEAASEERGRQYQQWQADYTARRKPGERLSLLTQTLGAIPDPQELESKYGPYGKRQNMPVKVQWALPARASLLKEMKELRASWKPEFQQLFSKNQGLLAWLGSGNAAKAITRNGLEELVASGNLPEGISPESIRDAAIWFTKWERVVNMPIRHENFGSALTAMEDARFRQAMMLNENTSPDAAMRAMEDVYSEIEQNTKDQIQVWGRVSDPEAVIAPFRYETGGDVFSSPVGGGNSVGGAGVGVGGDAYEEMKARLLGQ